MDHQQTSFIDKVEASSGGKVVVVKELHGNISLDGRQTDNRDQRNRKAAIKRVRSDWIEGLLLSSLQGIAKVELRLETQTDAVDWGVRLLVQVSNQEPVAVPRGANVGDVFERLGQALLILGHPGTGKTTLLLELAKLLLDKAEADPSHPIPMVFNLSSWPVKRQKLEHWLIDEMNERSDIPRKIGTEWIKNDQVIPLLDGFDEVGNAYRSSCVDAINGFREEHGLLPIAVCSRSADYEELGRKLRLRNAVMIQVLEPAEVIGALSYDPALTKLAAAVKVDSTLAEMLRTPLMLWVAVFAHRQADTRIVTGGGIQETRERLFASYVQAMFRRRSGSIRYPQVATRAWLQRLANVLKQNNLTVFTLEGLN
jgi:energy-coupling factor transporter ATP-binding protein EcfA2